MIKATVTKWGNSLALRIPRPIAEQLGIKENSNVFLELEGDRLIIKHGQSLDEMLALVTDENKQQLIDFGAQRGKEII
ncbi:MAG: AbrB/MazE/SpoVT family DNA-binding domain-containing protein [Pelolinea sp.]|nr:AbrB/MazE/SpoVT family DNA-binding domain-containing protein [Pelolinea sp.]